MARRSSNSSGVRIIAGPRNKSFDHFIEDLIRSNKWGTERVYFGITNNARAETVRRRMKTAGQHLGVSVKAFWQECGGCKDGGDDCRYHVLYSVYDKEAARKYRASVADMARKKTR